MDTTELKLRFTDPIEKKRIEIVDRVYSIALPQYITELRQNFTNVKVVQQKDIGKRKLKYDKVYWNENLRYFCLFNPDYKKRYGKCRSSVLCSGLEHLIETIEEQKKKVPNILFSFLDNFSKGGEWVPTYYKGFYEEKFNEINRHNLSDKQIQIVANLAEKYDVDMSDYWVYCLGDEDPMFSIMMPPNNSPLIMSSLDFWNEIQARIFHELSDKSYIYNTQFDTNKFMTNNHKKETIGLEWMKRQVEYHIFCIDAKPNLKLVELMRKYVEHLNIDLSDLPECYVKLFKNY